MQLSLSESPQMREEVTPIVNDEELAIRNKPKQGTGLWTSTWRQETQDSDWIEWCRDNNFGNPDGKYWHLLTPRSDINLYVIDCHSDLKRLFDLYLWDQPYLAELNRQFERMFPEQKENERLKKIFLSQVGTEIEREPFMAAIDFEKLSQAYDGIWLTEQGNAATRLSFPYNLYSWDCESILWFRWCFERVKTIQPVPALEGQPKITHVYHWQNDLVMVFDQFGGQMPEYQGPFEEVEAKIKAVYDGPWMQGDYPAGKVWHKGEQPSKMSFIS